MDFELMLIRATNIAKPAAQRSTRLKAWTSRHLFRVKNAHRKFLLQSTFS